VNEQLFKVVLVCSRGLYPTRYIRCLEYAAYWYWEGWGDPLPQWQCPDGQTQTENNNIEIRI